MSKEDDKQTLLLKEDEKEWLEVLHGQIPTVDDNDNHIDASTIRNYLIARDEAIALNTVVDSKALGTISPEEARVIYRRTSDRIRRQSENTLLSFFKRYGLAALVGGLLASVGTAFFLSQNDVFQTSLTKTTHSDLNYSDYPPLGFNEEPGPLPNMLLIPGGTTNIGCAKGWDDLVGGCRPSEFPSHAVTVKPFEIAQHEVTVGQFRQFIDDTQYVTDAEKENRGCVHENTSAAGSPYVMNPKLNWQSPGYEQSEAHPVTCVSWFDAQAYIAWLSEQTKTTYRLPSETEWEHAARAGQSTAYFWGSDTSHDQANYSGIGSKDQWEFASPVGRFPANKYNVQDTAGNLWEWVQDCWHDTYHGAPSDGSAWDSDCKNPILKVRRGGAWDMNAAGIRSAIRSKGAHHDRSNLYGFRVARDWQKQ